MTNRTSRWCGLVAAIALLSASPAFAKEREAQAPPDPTPEARAEMATAHQKMADCLKSDRPMADCRAEMMKSCQGMKGDGGCPMGGGMGPGHGKGPKGGGMMKGEPAPETPKE